MTKFLSLLMILSLSVSCSSKKKVKDVDNSKTIAKDYEVKDSSSNVRPGWIEDAEIWAEQEKMDTAKYRFFSYETEPKVSRDIACNLAQANTRATIAGEITTFIQRSLAASTEGQSAIDPNNPDTKPVREYISTTLSERVQSLIHGAAVIKTYWEKRNYYVKMGAKKDYVAFTCATLIRMDAARLSSAIDKAAEEIVKKAPDQDIKDNVKKALENLNEDFVKARQGEI